VVTYEYSAFGQCTSSAWTGTHDSSDPNPFRFSTHYQDENGLIYMGMRYYKADWGRFITRDHCTRKHALARRYNRPSCDQRRSRVHQGFGTNYLRLISPE
jgi:RHS repeat-associated protein